MHKCRMVVGSAEEVLRAWLHLHVLMEHLLHCERHPSLMMFFIVWIFEQKNIPVPQWVWGPLLGFTRWSTRNKGATWGWCESCAHGGLFLWFAEQLSTGLAWLTSSHGLGSPGSARRCGFGLRKVKWAPQVSVTSQGTLLQGPSSRQKWWSWRGSKLQRQVSREQHLNPVPLSGSSGATLGPPRCGGSPFAALGFAECCPKATVQIYQP